MDHSISLTLYGLASATSLGSTLVVLLAQQGIFALPLLFAALWLAPGRGRPARRRAALAGLVAVALAGLVVLTADHLFYRPRPFFTLGLVPLFPHSLDSSFPSDHSLLTAAAVLPLLWLRPKLGVWGLLWALAIGFARVAAGVHYATDVLGSALLAAIPAVIALVAVAVLLEALPALRGVVGEPVEGIRQP